MADNVNITPGSGNIVAADEVVDGTLGTVKVQYVKLMDGAIDGTTKAGVGANGLKVDGSAVTQPVSGTVTANIGTSGSLALDASVTGLEVVQGSTTSGQKGILELGAVTTAAPSYTTAQTSPLSLNTAGGLRVDGSGVTQPVSGTVTANAGTNLNTSLLALDSSVTGLSLAQNAATSGQKGILVQGAVTGVGNAFTSGNTSPINLNTQGAVRAELVPPVSGGRVIFSASTGSITPAATATDIVVISTSAAKVVRIFRIELFTSQTTAGINNWFIVRRSTLDTAGTSAAVTAIAHDTGGAASQATVLKYTANPTLGTTVGTIASSSVLSPSLTTVYQPGYVWDFSEAFFSGVVLRGSTQQIALNFNGAAIPTGMVIQSCNIYWSEE